MTICNKLHPTLRMRCARGKAHVANGMPHRSGAGYTWDLGEEEMPIKETIRPLTPNEELRMLIGRAIERRVERSRHGASFERLLSFNRIIDIAHDVVEEMYVANGRLYGQKYQKRR
jgi:hypothetical protein